MTKNNNHNLEVRVRKTHMTSEGDMIVSGYVNMTDTLSHELGFTDKFVEKIAPGAFTRAINRASDNGEDIDFLAEHDDTLVLASTKNGTLTLSEDDKGLYMEARIINTSSGRDYYEMIKSGIITNMSFGFYAVDDDWRSVRSDLYERTVKELELFEVSAVRRPAYAASSISNRGLNMADESVPENIKEASVMEQRTSDQLLNAIESLTQEIRKMNEKEDEKKKAKLGDNDKKEENVPNKEVEGKVDKDQDGKDVKKEEEKEDKKNEKVEKENSDADVEKEKESKDTKVDEKDVEKVKDDDKKVEDEKVKDEDKESKNDIDDDKMGDDDDKDDKDDEDKKKKKKDDERSYSLFRKEFEELRGGNK